ncbi:MAG: HPr family phosphocarrier protein [Betaproteobacteria bacterium]|nr:HPr family phosphocarrier protein [Betaproteobacteria bacterium]
MQTRIIVVSNPHGLHAQACARIVNIAKRCRCSLSLVVNGRRASARNIFAVMLLTAVMGVSVRIEANGPEEDAAMREIAQLFHDGFGERR